MKQMLMNCRVIDILASENKIQDSLIKPENSKL